MQNDFTHLLSSLTVALKEADDLYKNRADPVLSDYTVTEMHCIENIGKTESPNVTKLAATMNLTRGGVSKMIKKILKKGAAEAYTDEANKKEIYYRLTDLGKRVFDAHEELHEQWRKNDEAFFERFSAKAIAFGNRFIKKNLKHLTEFTGGKP